MKNKDIAPLRANVPLALWLSIAPFYPHLDFSAPACCLNDFYRYIEKRLSAFCGEDFRNGKRKAGGQGEDWQKPGGLSYQPTMVMSRRRTLE